MKKRQKNWLVGLFLLTSMLLIAGCGTSKSETKNDTKEEKTVNIAISGEGKAKELDATGYKSAMALYSAIYEPLVNYGEKGKFSAGLADSWEISEDGKQYTFHLKKNIKFSDGSDFNSEAVKFTLERAKHQNEETSLQTLTNLEKIETPDERTIVLSFNKVSNQVLAELCQTRPLRIMSPNSVKDQSVEGKFEKAIGTGPFVVTDATDERTTMTPNEHYNEGNPVDYKVTFQTIEDGSARTAALRSGDIDIAGGTLGNISPEDISTLKKDNNYQTHEFQGTMSHFLAFNPENKTLQSDKVRKAIDMMTDKKALSQNDLKGLFQPTVQYVDSSNQPKSTYDLEAATALLEEDGYKKNKDGYFEKDGQVLSFNLVIQTTEFPEWKKKAEILESEWKKAGIKLVIKTVDMETYYDTLWTTKEYDVIFYRTYTDALLPYYFLTSLFYNKAGESGVLANDATLTQLLDDYAQLIDEEERQEVFNKIFTRMSDQSLAVPIEYVNEEFVTSKKIKTFKYAGLSDAPISFKDLVVE